MNEFNQQLADWKEINQISRKVIQGEPESYLEAIKNIDPFSEIQQLGSYLEFNVHGNIILANLFVKGEEVIPSNQRHF